MTVLFIILVVLVCVILGFIVLVQNPKGGGLSGNVAGFSNQFMGVKQTTDVLEKGTWIFAAAIAILCVTSKVFIVGRSSKASTDIEFKNSGQSKGNVQKPAAAYPAAPAPAKQP